MGEVGHTFDTRRGRIGNSPECQADSQGTLAAKRQAAAHHYKIGGIGGPHHSRPGDRARSGNVGQPSRGRVVGPDDANRSGGGRALLAGRATDRC